jgi:high-affinity iron transporter
MGHRHALSLGDESEEQSHAPAGDSIEESERLVFLLQYLATDYERAVQNGQIVDSLEYREMQRFASYAAKIYQSTTALQQQTLNKLRQLEELISNCAALPHIRKICDEVIAILIKEKNLFVAPRRTPDIDYGKNLYEENCVPCHGLLGAGDGASADTLNPRPRDFTDPERMNLCTPLQFYHAITFGVEGTAMPSFSEALAPRPRWNLAFYLMTLRRDFQPVAPANPLKLTLQDLATKSNIELADMILSRQRLAQADSSSDPKHIVDYYRQNPPEQTMDDHANITEEGLKQSLAAYQRGDFAGADRFAQEAYWDGFELMEGLLLWQVYLAFERVHAEYLLCIEQKDSSKKAQALVKKMLKMLEQIRKQKELWRTP